MSHLIPGHEFSGQVEKCGPAADNKWSGKRVGIFPLIPCGECVLCKKKLFEMCRDYSYLGSRRHGGFAEYAAVPEKNLIELPDNVSFEEAAMLEPMAVAVHSIRRTVINNDDIIALVITEKLSAENEDLLNDLIVDFDLKYDKVFSVIDIEKSTMTKWINSVPFYQNLEREGIILWTVNYEKMF